MLLPIVIGAGLMFVGYGLYSGRGKLVRRLPLLTQSQQGLLLIAAGAISVVWGLVSYL